MAKLTMNTPGSDTPRQADFLPPGKHGVQNWVAVGAAGLFLVVFTALVVTTTLLITQPGQTEATVIAFDEPSLAELTELVTRQELSLLQAEAELAANGLAAPTGAALPAIPGGAPQEQAAAQIKAAVDTPQPKALGAEHRYRIPSCVDFLDTLVKITTVNFAVGSDVPDPADMIRARSIATAVKTCDEVKVIVEGHSDRRGNDKLNMDLSWFRAQSVIDQLQSEGFDVLALQPRGFGATRPVNLSGTVSGEAENRRVQFTLAPRALTSPFRVSNN